MAPKKLDDDAVLRAFRACPDLHVDKLRQLLPNVVTVIEPLADALCVSWTSVLLAVLVAVSALAPEDSLQIAPSVEVRGVVWACLLHPGSTNSSGVIGVVSAALDSICKRRHQAELRCAEARAEANGEDEWERPPRRQLLAGGGSLAAAGLQMSQEQNRGAAVAVEPELDAVVQWLTATRDWGRGFESPTLISKPVVDAVYLLCDSFETTWELLDFASSSHTLPTESEMSVPQAASQALQATMDSGDESRLQLLPSKVKASSWLKADLDFWIGISIDKVLLLLPQWIRAGVCTEDSVVALMKAMLHSEQKWFVYSDHSKSLKRSLPEAHKDNVVFLSALAGKILAALGLGHFVRTVIVAGDRGGGRPTWLYCRCPVEATMHHSLELLGISADSTPPLQAYMDIAASSADVPAGAIPARAPSVETLTNQPGAAQEQILRALGLEVDPTQILSATPPRDEVGGDDGAGDRAARAAGFGGGHC